MLPSRSVFSLPARGRGLNGLHRATVVGILELLWLPLTSNANSRMKGLKTDLRQQRMARWSVAIAAGAALVAGGGWLVRAASPTARFERAREFLRANSPEGVHYELLSLDRRANCESRAGLLRAWLRLKEVPSEKDKLARQKAAWTDLTFAVDDPECRPLALALMGRILYEQEHLAEALKVLDQALRLGPQEVETYRWLGIAAYDIGDTAKATEYLERVAALEPANGLPHRLIGLMLKEKGEFASAAAAYELSLERDPDQPGADEVRFELAECLRLQRDYEAALSALERCTDTAEVLVLRAECYHALVRHRQANECVERALALDAEMPEALALKGKMCSEAGDEKEAAEWVARAVERKPNDYRLHYQLLQSYQRLGEEALAADEARQIEELRRMSDELDELLAEADRNVADARLRYRIAELASRLDMHELAQNWAKAARLVESAVPPRVEARP